MKTVLIDNSLCEINYFPKVSQKDISEYIISLSESGANYIELDYKTLFKMKELPEQANHIFYINNTDSIFLTEMYNFSYAVLPLQYLHKINSINIPVILEIEVSQSMIEKVLEMISHHNGFDKVSMIRLKGNFDIDIYNFVFLMKRLKAKYCIPFDICPTNKKLTAVSMAIIAFASRAESITLSFGKTTKYASFEEFIITLFSVYGLSITKDLTGICKATVMKKILSPDANDNLRDVIRCLEKSSRYLVNIDTAKIMKNVYNTKSIEKKPYISPTEKYLDSIELPDDIVTDMKSALENYGLDIARLHIDYKKIMIQ